MSDETSKTPGAEPASWIIHGEREVDATRRLRLSIASVELPDGVEFEQYVMRIPAAAMCLLVDDANRVLMLRRHRFILDRWVWELPGGYLEDGEDPAACAAREAVEEPLEGGDLGHVPMGIEAPCKVPHVVSGSSRAECAGLGQCE